MIFHTFVRKSVNIFFDKKEGKCISGRVKRGRAATSSAELEDLLAKAVADAIPKEYNILVDYPMSYNPSSRKRTKTIFPDIAIVKDNTLRGIIEFKSDLGYLQKNWSKQNKVLFEKFRQSKYATYKDDVGSPGSKEILKIRKGLKRCVAVLTDRNEHGKMPKFRKDNKCFVLTTGEYHPNSHKVPIEEKDRIINDLALNSSGWDKFMKYLSRTYK